MTGGSSGGGIPPDPDGAEHRTVLSALGLDPEGAALMQQVHGSRVRLVAQGGTYPACDALVTLGRGLPLVVRAADCVPVLFYDPRTPAVGAVHAGWRGTDAGVTRAAVRMMQEWFGTQCGDLAVFIGPSAGACCYEVGGEVAERFEPAFRRERGGRHFLDLKGANAAVLLGAGVPPDRIEISPLCTICRPDLLCSYRRDGPRAGRMAAVIALSPVR